MKLSRIIAAGFLTLLVCIPALTQTPVSRKNSPEKPQAPSAVTEKLKVQAHLDRTAIWVGDRVTYTIEIVCQPNVDILSADLSPEKLALENLKVVGNEIERKTEPGDVTKYRFQYFLTTYSVDAPALKIGAMAVRFYVKRQGQQLSDAAPLGEVQVPAASVAFRSLLPDNQAKYTIRDDEPAATRPPQYAMLSTVGLVLIVIFILPAAWFAFEFGRRVWQRPSRNSLHVQEEGNASLHAVRSMSVGTVEERREVYERVNALVRRHIGEVYGVNARSMTPVEITPALSARDGQFPIELVAAVLGACDLALYAPIGAVPSAESCQHTVEQAGRVLASGR